MPERSLAPAATYEIDPAHSSAQFTVKHLMISNVHGQFSKVTGTLDFNPNNPAMDSVKATIDASTVNTQEPKRDEHLKSPDFLDVAKFPTITFQSTSFRKMEDGKYKVAGDLTIHGVTKRVVLDADGPSAEVKDPWGNAEDWYLRCHQDQSCRLRADLEQGARSGRGAGRRRGGHYPRDRVRQKECRCLSNT